MLAEKMTAAERRGVISLASIMSLRMIGLFMVMPVFSLYVQQLAGATPFLLGIAMGIYGLAQAILQIPFGALSDRFGRKPIILTGLIIFTLGSLLAGMAHSMTLMIIGRTLQGVGAIGSTILAMIADLTREEQRTKAMAITGMSIGASFALAMLLGPVLADWMPVNYLFYLASLFGVIAITLLLISVPTPLHTTWHRDTEPELKSFLKLLVEPELAKLNIGIFFLHALFTASFIVIPISLLTSSGIVSSRQWLFYLPTLFVACIFTLICVGIAERKQKLKPFFLSSILMLILAECLLWLGASSHTAVAIGLCLFFSGFTLLESFLPSLISRTAPAARKGSALGIYSCAQFFGIFVGGVLGGWLYGQFSFGGVYLCCIIFALSWFILALFMQPLRYLTTQLWRITPARQRDWGQIAAKLHVIPGMVEVTFIAEDGVAYLKMARETAKHPDYLQLKEQIIEPVS